MLRRVRIRNRKAGGLWWRVPAVLLIWSIIAAPILLALIAWSVVRDHAEGLPLSPDLDTWLAKAPRSNLIVAADNSVLAELPFYRNGQSGHRMVVSYEQIPTLLVEAILAAEDLRFFEHSGVDTRAVIRAAWENYEAGRVVQGASTITQQLARNLVERIGNERSLRRKIREALLARRIERYYDKPTIFAAYANYVFLGANAYGVAAAARAYFSKSLGELTVAEAALIAGLIQIPGRGNPYQNPEGATARRDVVLQRMQRAGFILEEEYLQARARPVELTPPIEHYGQLAPWATEEARKEVEALLPEAFARGGLRIETTAEPTLSQRSEDLGRERTLAMAGQDEAPPQIGAILFDHHSGYIEVMVGGTDWQDSKFNRSTQSCRQPGSAFKPLVYGAALQARVITPATALRDGPISEYDENLQVYWKPSNSGRVFRGVAIAQDALAASLNTPAVDVYDRVGGAAVIAFAKQMGITTPLRDLRPLALGASCVVPVQLAGAYAVIARDGLAVTPRLVRRVVDNQNGGYDHAVYFDAQLSGSRRLDRMAAAAGRSAERTLDPITAYQLRSMLRDVVTRGTGAAARKLAVPVAGKTGTTNDNTDAWFVGFSARVTAAVWLGHDDPTLNLGRGMDGSHAALPIWMRMIEMAERQRTARPLPGPPPADSETARIDRESGFLAAPGAGGALDLYFHPGTVPTEHAGSGFSAGQDFARSSRGF